MQMAAFLAQVALPADATANLPPDPRRRGAPALGRVQPRPEGPDARSKLSRDEMRLARNLIRDVLLLERLQTQ